MYILQKLTFCATKCKDALIYTLLLVMADVRVMLSLTVLTVYKQKIRRNISYRKILVLISYDQVLIILSLNSHNCNLHINTIAKSIY